jgi:hypothetical protein
MKVLLATPLIDGRGEREFISGLLECHGLYHAWACVEGQSHISLARDLLATQFLESDCDTLVFIDGDIGFRRAHLDTLLQAPRPLVSGLYPRKFRDGPWIFRPEVPAAEADPLAGGLLPVLGVPTGFLRIERRVFQKLIDAAACAPYNLNGKTHYHFFRAGVSNGVFLSEDYFFSELARSVGFQPYIHPEIRLNHVGRMVYTRES